MNCSYVACNSFIKANVPHYITSEPRVTAEHLGSGTTKFFIISSLASCQPRSSCLCISLSYEYHLSSSTQPSILPCEQALWIKTLTTWFILPLLWQRGETVSMYAFRMESWQKMAWRHVTRATRPPESRVWYKSGRRLRRTQLKKHHPWGKPLRRFALLFSARIQLTSDFQVFLSIQVEEMNSALLSVFHSSFRM